MQSISAVSSYQYTSASSVLYQKSDENAQQSGALSDTVSFGNSPVSSKQSMSIVYERAFAKLQAVVGDARAALGLQDGDVLDTSPEATGNRIADFALGSYNSWRERHSDIEEDAAREQFSKYIGGAVQQGIEEARGILQSLNALNGDTDKNINSTWETVQQRLDDFVSGK
jgi:hypothetical protein